MSKKLSKYIAAVDYIKKTLIILSPTSGGISITSFTGIIGIPAGIASASFTLIFSLTTGIIKKLLKVTRKKNKKRNKIVILAKSKLNSIEALMPQALIDLDTRHKEFKTIVNEKEKYEQEFKTIVNEKEKYKQMKESISNMQRIEMNSVKIVEILEKIMEMHRLKKYIVFVLCI